MKPFPGYIPPRRPYRLPDDDDDIPCTGCGCCILISLLIWAAFFYTLID